MFYVITLDKLILYWAELSVDNQNAQLGQLVFTDDIAPVM